MKHELRSCPDWWIVNKIVQVVRLQQFATVAQGRHKHFSIFNVTMLFFQFVCLTIADDLKCKIWKIYANIFLLHPLRRVENTPIEKKYKIVSLQN